MEIYQCICGVTFDNPQKYNGHKSNCKIHLLHKYGNLDIYNNRITVWHNAGVSGYISMRHQKATDNLNLWLSEPHYCKTCGKLMHEYYGSGVYCSRSCANTRNHTDAVKQKIGVSIKKCRPSAKPKKYCLLCNKPLRVSNKSGYCIDCYRSHKVFSNSTRQKLRESAIRRDFGGFNFRNKGIYYNGQKLDSSYEVQVAKSLDANNIEWVRPKSVYYIDNTGKRRRYMPDFYLPVYDVYLDPKNDYLIHHVNKSLGFSDVDKINWVMQQNNIKVIILNKSQLDWSIIKTLI